MIFDWSALEAENKYGNQSTRDPCSFFRSKDFSFVMFDRKANKLFCKKGTEINWREIRNVFWIEITDLLWKLKTKTEIKDQDFRITFEAIVFRHVFYEHEDIFLFIKEHGKWIDARSAVFPIPKHVNSWKSKTITEMNWQEIRMFFLCLPF